MSEEIKKTEQPELVEVAELAEQELDQVAGGKNYFESRSNIQSITPPITAPKPSPTTQPVPPKTTARG